MAVLCRMNGTQLWDGTDGAGRPSEVSKVSRSNQEDLKGLPLAIASCIGISCCARCFRFNYYSSYRCRRRCAPFSCRSSHRLGCRFKGWPAGANISTSTMWDARRIVKSTSPSQRSPRGTDVCSDQRWTDDPFDVAASKDSAAAVAALPRGVEGLAARFNRPVMASSPRRTVERRFAPTVPASTGDVGAADGVDAPPAGDAPLAVFRTTGDAAIAELGAASGGDAAVVAAAAAAATAEALAVDRSFRSCRVVRQRFGLIDLRPSASNPMAMFRTWARVLSAIAAARLAIAAASFSLAIRSRALAAASAGRFAIGSRGSGPIIGKP